MASFSVRENSDGTLSYKVSIRKKGHEFYKSFSNEEDAKLYAFYKERLIENMENFEVPLREMVTLEQVFELKINSIPKHEKRAIAEYENVLKNLIPIFKDKKFLKEISYEEWENASRYLYNTDVYRGGKTENSKRKMSIATLRRWFANASSVISYARSQGIEIDNHPLKVIQSHITPLMKKQM